MSFEPVDGVHAYHRDRFAWFDSFGIWIFWEMIPDSSESPSIVKKDPE